MAFWLAYIVTRPLGVSLGDLLSQPRDTGGLELGTVVTSILFLSAITLIVTYLAKTKKDVIATPNRPNVGTTTQQKSPKKLNMEARPERLVWPASKPKTPHITALRTQPKRRGVKR